MTHVLRDPHSERLLGAAHDFLSHVFFLFWTPSDLAAFGEIFQWQKFDLLDWLRPLEKLLRRVLLTEAIALALSQSLPKLAARQRVRKSCKPRPRIDLSDLDPSQWPASFRVTGPLPKSRPHGGRRLPHPFEKPPGEPRPMLRYRRVLHPAQPLALRLQAIIRILDDPAPRIRRLAYSLSRTPRERTLGVLLPLARHKPAFLREALDDAFDRCSQMVRAYWNPE